MVSVTSLRRIAMALYAVCLRGGSHAVGRVPTMRLFEHGSRRAAYAVSALLVGDARIEYLCHVDPPPLPPDDINGVIARRWMLSAGFLVISSGRMTPKTVHAHEVPWIPGAALLCSTASTESIAVTSSFYLLIFRERKYEKE